MRKLLAVVLCCLVLTACLGNIEMGPGLDTISKGFSESMRWGDYSTAAAYVMPDARSAFLEQFAEDDDLHVVDSHISSINIYPDGKRADVSYVMEYYHLPSSRIKKWHWKQQWRQIDDESAESGSWMIKNEPPALPWNK